MGIYGKSSDAREKMKRRLFHEDAAEPEGEEAQGEGESGRERRRSTPESKPQTPQKKEHKGNWMLNRIAYGLLAGAGVDTRGMEPREAWDALRQGYGITMRGTLETIRKNGNADDLKKKIKEGKGDTGDAPKAEEPPKTVEPPKTTETPKAEPPTQTGGTGGNGTIGGGTTIGGEGEPPKGHGEEYEANKKAVEQMLEPASEKVAPKMKMISELVKLGTDSKTYTDKLNTPSIMTYGVSGQIFQNGHVIVQSNEALSKNPSGGVYGAGKLPSELDNTAVKYNTGVRAEDISMSTLHSHVQAVHNAAKKANKTVKTGDYAIVINGKHNVESGGGIEQKNKAGVVNSRELLNVLGVVGNPTKVTFSSDGHNDGLYIEGSDGKAFIRFMKKSPSEVGAIAGGATEPKTEPKTETAPTKSKDLNEQFKDSLSKIDEIEKEINNHNKIADSGMEWWIGKQRDALKAEKAKIESGLESSDAEDKDTWLADISDRIKGIDKQYLAMNKEAKKASEAKKAADLNSIKHVMSKDELRSMVSKLPDSLAFHDSGKWLDEADTDLTYMEDYTASFMKNPIEAMVSGTAWDSDTVTAAEEFEDMARQTPDKADSDKFRKISQDLYGYIDDLDFCEHSIEPLCNSIKSLGKNGVPDNSALSDFRDQLEGIRNKISDKEFQDRLQVLDKRHPGMKGAFDEVSSAVDDAIKQVRKNGIDGARSAAESLKNLHHNGVNHTKPASVPEPVEEIQASEPEPEKKPRANVKPFSQGELANMTDSYTHDAGYLSEAYKTKDASDKLGKDIESNPFNAQFDDSVGKQAQSAAKDFRRMAAKSDDDSEKERLEQMADDMEGVSDDCKFYLSYADISDTARSIANFKITDSNSLPTLRNKIQRLQGYADKKEFKDSLDAFNERHPGAKDKFNSAFKKAVDKLKFASEHGPDRTKQALSDFKQSYGF